MNNVLKRALFLSAFPALSLALVLGMIDFNRVGSPQFIVWLAAPLLFGLALRARGFRVLAALGLVIAGMTQVIYPLSYWVLTELQPTMLVFITMRNALLVLLLIAAVAALCNGPRANRAGSRPTTSRCRAPARA